MFRSSKFSFEISFCYSSFASDLKSASSSFLSCVSLISSATTRAIISSDMFFNLTATFFVVEIKRWLKKFLTAFAISRFALFFAFFSFLIKRMKWSFRQFRTMITSLKQITMFEKRSRLFRLTKIRWQSFKSRVWSFKTVICFSLIFKNRRTEASVFKSYLNWSQRILICCLCELRSRDVRWKQSSTFEVNDVSENWTLRSRRFFNELIITEKLKEIISMSFQTFLTILNLKIAFRKRWKIFKKFKRLNLTFSCFIALFTTLSWCCL